MRQPVPFIDEKLIGRLDGDEAESQSRGKAINEMLSTLAEVSSWDDLVIIPTTPKSGSNSPSSSHPSSKTFPANIHQSPDKITKTHIDWILINNGHGLRIKIDGNIDLQLSAEWQRLLRETAGNGVAQFEFNLDQSPFLSLTGLAMLMLFKEQKKSRKQDIKLCHCNRQTWELLLWTGMDQHFVIEGEHLAAI